LSRTDRLQYYQLSFSRFRRRRRLVLLECEIAFGVVQSTYYPEVEDEAILPSDAVVVEKKLAAAAAEVVVAGMILARSYCAEEPLALYKNRRRAAAVVVVADAAAVVPIQTARSWTRPAGVR